MIVKQPFYWDDDFIYEEQSLGGIGACYTLEIKEDESSDYLKFLKAFDLPLPVKNKIGFY